jgi:Trk K+ transport system NAD-binding subunit
VIVVGLGNNGYRVHRLLSDLGIATAVVEATPNVRFTEAVRARAVVLVGDARLPETLQRVAVEEAVALLACTSNDLANIQACLHGRRLNPKLRTVARIFDDELAERLSNAFAIDAAISPSKVVAGAFVGAATDERAQRAFQLGGQHFLAFRYDVPESIAIERMEAWRAEGLRLLAFRRKAGLPQRPSELTEPLEPGDMVIVAGPQMAVRQVLFHE